MERAEVVKAYYPEIARVIDEQPDRDMKLLLINALYEKVMREEKQASEEIEKSFRDIVIKTIKAGDYVKAEQEIKRLTQLTTPPEKDTYSFDDLKVDLDTLPTGVNTGYKSLDRYVSLLPGLNIVAGRTGHGKTTLMLNMLTNMAGKEYKNKQMFFSLEEARPIIATKIFMILNNYIYDANKNFGYTVGHIKREDDERVKSIKPIFETMMDNIRVESETWDVNDILKKIEGYKKILKDKGQEVNVVFIDYVQLIRPAEKLGNRMLEITSVLRTLREYAVANNMAIVLGAQLRRDDSDKKAIRLQNLKEAGTIEEEASTVIAIYNQQQDSEVDTEDTSIEISVLKNRMGQTNRRVNLKFTPATLKIRDLEV